MNPIERIETALKARYNVRELPEHLASAVAAAKAGDLDLLEQEMEGREMYRWTFEVRAAFRAARAPAAVAEPEAEEPAAEEASTAASAVEDLAPPAEATEETAPAEAAPPVKEAPSAKPPKASTAKPATRRK